MISILPISKKAKDRVGKMPVQCMIERSDNGKMFVCFIGHNYWAWIQAIGDPNFMIVPPD